MMEDKVREKWDWDQTYKSIPVQCISARKELGQDSIPTEEVKQIALEMAQIVKALPEVDFCKYIEGVTKAEIKLRGYLEGHVLVGRSDGRGVLDGESYYVDWKMNERASSGASRQLAFYSLIEPVDKAFVYYPMIDVFKPARVTGKRMDRLREEVLRLIKGIMAREFPRKYSFCPYCLFLEECRSPSVVKRLRQYIG